MTFTYLIALGSNLGDRRLAIQRATQDVANKVGIVLAASRLYETEPIGNADLLFLNAACLVQSTLKPLDLMSTLLAIEADMGRVRGIHWGNRIIDLDIIMAKDSLGEPVVLSSEALILPHPRCLERDFVIIPVADVCPDWIFPGQSRSFLALASERAKVAKVKTIP